MMINGKDYDFLIKVTDTVPALKVSLSPGRVSHCGDIVFSSDKAKEIVAFCAGMMTMYEHLKK